MVHGEGQAEPSLGLGGMRLGQAHSPGEDWAGTNPVTWRSLGARKAVQAAMGTIMGRRRGECRRGAPKPASPRHTLQAQPAHERERIMFEAVYFLPVECRESREWRLTGMSDQWHLDGEAPVWSGS